MTNKENRATERLRNKDPPSIRDFWFLNDISFNLKRHASQCRHLMFIVT